MYESIISTYRYYWQNHSLLVDGGCAAECCCRSVARCAASSYCRSFVSRAAEISRSGTLHSPCCTSAAIYPVHESVTRSLSRKSFTPASGPFYGYFIRVYLTKMFINLDLFILCILICLILIKKIKKINLYSILILICQIYLSTTRN